MRIRFKADFIVEASGPVEASEKIAAMIRGDEHDLVFEDDSRGWCMGDVERWDRILEEYERAGGVGL